MIIRISTEGQYAVSDGDIAGLNELDNAAVVACEDDDESKFHETFARLLDYVRSNGEPVPDDDMVGSDLILPPPDVTLVEAKQEFSGEGLIPG